MKPKTRTWVTCASVLASAATIAIMAGAASAQSAFVKVGPETVYDAGERCGGPWFAVADFNVDGRPDFAVGMTGNSANTPNAVPGAVMLWMAQPDGSFKEMASPLFSGPVTSAISYANLRAADFNGDGVPDIYVPDYGIDTPELLNTGSTPKLALSTSAGFVDASARFAGLTPRKIHTGAIADIEGNGTVDLYVGSNTGAPVPGSKPFLLLNDGRGNFTFDQSRLPALVLTQQPAQGARAKQIDATTWYVADERFTGSVFADVNRDGYPDLVLEPTPFAPNGFVFLNDGRGDFSKLPPIELPPGAYGGNWLIVKLTASGWFDSPQARAPGPGTVHLDTRAADLDGDGYPDLVVLQTLQQDSPEVRFYRGGRIQILINKGGRGFVDESAARGAPGFDAPRDYEYYVGTLTVADVNGDGFPDIVATRTSGAGNLDPHVYLNDGNGRFTRATLEGIPATGFYVVVSGGFQQPTRIVNVQHAKWVYNASNQRIGCSLSVQTYERRAPSLKAFDLNQHGLTGSWYAAATGGQGVEVEVFANPSAGTGSAFASWFTYDGIAGGAERQRWYTAQGPVVTGQPNAALTIYRNMGGNFNSPPVTSAQVVGTAMLSFDTCTSGHFSYAFTDGTGRTGTIPLTRLTQNVTCSTTSSYPANADFALSGNWFGGAATSGQGFTVEVNPNSGAFFAAWYTYMPNGAAAGAAGQRWYTAQAAFTPGLRAVPVTIYETTGGMFDTPSPPGQKTVPVGTGTMTFQSCSAATFSYNVTGGSSGGLSGTINLSRVGSLPPGCTT